MPNLKKQLFDAACILSIFGIWPRFIEPSLLKISRLTLKIAQLKHPLKVAQISDLHLNSHLSNRFLNKICHTIANFKPDIIAFTGDFLCRSQMGDKMRLETFLNSFSAPLGCYAVLGNHDYGSYVFINEMGEYDMSGTPPPQFHRLFNQTKLQALVKGKSPLHHELIELLATTPFQLLHNKTVPAGPINLSGVGDYMAGHCHPKEAFANYDPMLPGITLAHNPDAIPHLKPFPGDLILCGHTHGAQINLPYFRERLTLIEERRYTRGLLFEDPKWIYINRGLGGTSPVRLFSPPEITLFTLVSDA